MIDHANIIYMPTISELGGIETYVYEMVKKYHYLDIAVVSKYCDEKQRERIEKYCKVYIIKDETIKCKVAIINYDQTIINQIDINADIYQTIHADYTNPIYTEKPKDHPRVKGFICITKYLYEKMAQYLPKEKLMLGYNPLTIDNEKPLILVSATRLHKHKGRERMQKLIDEMDRQGINYVWYILTNDMNVLKGNNVIFIKNRLDDDKWINQATYVVLLSDSEACSYLLSKALYRNIPIIVTPLPYLNEIGVKDNVNSYVVDFDCSNIKEVVSKLTNVPQFTFKKMNDKYKTLFVNEKSRFVPDYKIKTLVKVKTGSYYDMKLGRDVSAEEGAYEVTLDRAKLLVKLGICEYVDKK